MLATLATYLLLSLDELGRFPPVGQDEGWIAAAPYKLATEGVYGSNLFAGYYGMDRRNYEHMPLYPLMQAGVFRLLRARSSSVVIQMRLLPVACGFCLLLCVFLVAREIGGDWTGAVAVVLMTLLRVASNAAAPLPLGAAGTGILLLDSARINRYDIAVPVFALVALWWLIRAQRGEFTNARAEYSDHWAYGVAGALIGVASLAHLFGVFWLPVFLGIVLVRGRGSASSLMSSGLMVLGFGLTWLPWLLYVSQDWADFLGQTRYMRPRMAVFDASFLASNALHGPGPISLDWAREAIAHLPLRRVGAWTTIVGVPAALVLMMREGRVGAPAAMPGSSGKKVGRVDQVGDGGDPALVILPVVTVALVVMFAALLKVKTVRYMIGVWPLAIVVVAWCGVWLWNRRGTRRGLIRSTLVAWFLLIAADGGAGIAHARDAARRTSRYDWFESQIARCIPEGSLVLGLQHYWLGLRQFRFRSWLVPIYESNAQYVDTPVPFDRAIERVDPDILLIDRNIRTMLDEGRSPQQQPAHDLTLGFDAYLARHEVEPICVIRDTTYGTMEVHRVHR